MKTFDWDYFLSRKDVCVNCKTIEEAEEFCKLMDEKGLSWCYGKKYTSDSQFEMYKEKTVYYSDGTYADVSYAENRNQKILNWSDYSNYVIVLKRAEKILIGDVEYERKRKI